MKKIELYSVNDLHELVKEGDPRIQFRGDVFLDHKRNGEYLCFEEYMGKNIIPTEGLNAILDTSIGGVAGINPWYLGIFKTNYSPLASNTAATCLGPTGSYGECQDADYNPVTNRPVYTVPAAAGGVITNAAAKAEFDMLATITVYGAFIASSQAKSATSGKLLAAKKFDASRPVVAGDILYVTYQLTASSS